MKPLKYSLTAFWCLLLAACSNPYAIHYDNLKLAFLLNRDAEISLEEVVESEVDLATIKSGNRPVAIIAKAFNEFGKDKWLSKDRAMLVIDEYRVVRTIGFKNDQIEILSGQIDPLKELSTVNNKRWEWQVDWSVGEYGYPAVSEFKHDFATVTVLEHNFDVIHITETVTYLHKTGVLDSKKSWENHYWIDEGTGLLLKTQQKHAPFADLFTINFVSNAAKLISPKSQV